MKDPTRKDKKCTYNVIVAGELEYMNLLAKKMEAYSKFKGLFPKLEIVEDGMCEARLYISCTRWDEGSGISEWAELSRRMPPLAFLVICKAAKYYSISFYVRGQRMRHHEFTYQSVRKLTQVEEDYYYWLEFDMDGEFTKFKQEWMEEHESIL